jgi:RNA polymerase sigma-70 factor (ECF subfamily)
MNGKTPSFNVIGQLAALRRYALSLVRNPDEAEDLVHDALVKAYERQSTFRTGASVRNWLMSILHNAHVDRLRQRRSQERRHDAAAELAEASVPANQDHSVRLTQLRNAFFAYRKSSARPCTSSPSRSFPIRRPPKRSAFRSAR